MPVIQEVVTEIDPDLALAAPRTMGTVLREATGGRQFLMTMISLFALIAVILAMAGIFGTMAHNVAQRTREIGVRVAFGAHLGGFFAGLLLIPLFRNDKLVTAKREGVVLPREELDHGGWW